MYHKPNLPNDPVDKKFQFNVWHQNKKMGIFLNTDLHFFYDIDVDPMNGTRCRPSNINFGHMRGESLAKPVCSLAPADTRAIVDRYGVNTDASRKAFMEDFAAVLRKMLRHGYGNNLQTI